MKHFLSRSNYSEKLLELGRQKPSSKERIERYVDDLEIAIESFVIARQAGGGETELFRMMQEIAHCRVIYTQICERPLTAD